MILGLSTALSQALIGWSLTFSPMSLTQHFEEQLRPTPRHIAGHNSLTYHPQFSLLLEDGHFQAAAFYLSDTFANHAAGAVLGPKWSFFNDHFTLGGLFGLYARQDYFYENQALTYKAYGWQFMPMTAAVAGIHIPITKNTDFSINTAVTPILINQSYGIRFKF